MKNCVKCGAELQDVAVFCCLCGKKQTAEKRKAIKRANGTGTVYKLSGRRSRPWAAAKNKVVIGLLEKDGRTGGFGEAFGPPAGRAL